MHVERDQSAARRLRACAAAVFISGSIAVPAHAASAWRPDKAVEVIATNAPGGGSDRNSQHLRLIARKRGRRGR